jgi:hypothetical protein
MVEIKCPRCKSSVEVDEYKDEEKDKLAVFCSKKDCLYHKNPLIGIDKRTSEVFVSEALM